MSIYSENTKKAEEIDLPCKGIERILQAHITDLGGFSVRRVLPSPHQMMVGPWIFFDNFGPTGMPAGTGIDVRPHPHINMATVTYLLSGEILHQDSLNSIQIIKPGAVNVMFAGKGIVHSERTPADLRAAGHTIQGLQLWLAVPKAIEENPPGFYHYEADVVPRFQVGNISGRVLMGQAYGVSSPVITFSPTLYFEASLPKGSQLTMPLDPEEIGIYVLDGKIMKKDTLLESGMMGISSHHDGIQITALEDSAIAVIGGAPLGQRHIWWNFVSSSADRIKQAAQDWENNLFPEIPNDHAERIPLPERH